MNNAYDVSEPLRFLLGKKGITAYEFSKSVGINRAVTSQYLNGKKKASLSRIDLFCEYFGVERSFFTDFETSRLSMENEESAEVEDRQSLFDFLLNPLTEIYDDQLLNKHRKLFVQQFNYYFDTLEKNRKVDILTRMHNSLDQFERGKTKIDLKEDNITLWEMDKILRRNGVILSKEDLISIIENRKDNGVIDINEYAGIISGFLIGSNATIGKENYYKVSKIRRFAQVDDAFNKINIYNIDGFYSFVEMLEHLAKTEYYYALKSLRVVLGEIRLKEYEHVEKDIGILFGPLYKMDIECFDMVIPCIKDLIDGNIELLIVNLKKLEQLLQKRSQYNLTEINRLLLTIGMDQEISSEEVTGMSSEITKMIEGLEE